VEEQPKFAISGALKVTLVGAKNLKETENGNTADSYVKIRCVIPETKKEQTLFKTKVVKKSADPEWNESFSLPFPLILDFDSPQQMKLTLTVKHQSVLGSGSDLGTYELDVWSHFQSKQLQEVKPDGPAMTCDFWTKVGELKQGEQGTLHLKLSFQPLGRAPAKRERAISGTSSQSEYASSSQTSILKKTVGKLTSTKE
jgi:Ca2+-dependent lipid-binding protein